MSEKRLGERVRLRGLVQGVGMRPTIWRLAKELGLSGDVRNDGDEVSIRLFGGVAQCESFLSRLQSELPPLARIDSLSRETLAETRCNGFRIVDSDPGEVHGGVLPDAATCDACKAEILDSSDRRYRYPFGNCTHCGPRLSILRDLPYDRANTSMSAFPLCPVCLAEYADPTNRRFHAQPTACPVCGPRAWLCGSDGAELECADPIAEASRRLARGEILAIKGIGGFHLVCDATRGPAVRALRQRKGRYAKPFAMMVRDLAVLSRYARFNETEQKSLQSTAAPIVLLPGLGEQLPPEIAPGQDQLGFMLPYSPLHHLLLVDWDRPLVMTSGNRGDEPQCTGNREALERLAGIADAFLLHDRDIVNRLDDSVVRLMDDRMRPLRRARGLAPAPIPLGPGFADAPPLIALGGELKNTVCLLREGGAVVSQHLGDLEQVRSSLAFEASLTLYQRLYRMSPEAVAIDLHPNYRSSRYGKAWAKRDELELVQVQHHHAHIAAVMAERGLAVDCEPVLGIALDGLGLGDDGTLWGGEFLVADFAGYQRVGHLRSAPMPGGASAIVEPWRNAYAQLSSWLDWGELVRRYAGAPWMQSLQTRPLVDISRMIQGGINSPQTSSMGRLFDAVSFVLGLCPDRQAFEGQAAMALETLARRAGKARRVYQFESDERGIIDPAILWQALLSDLQSGRAIEDIAAAFHAGLAAAVVDMAGRLCGEHRLSIVALSGGVFQNRILFETVCQGLRGIGLCVLSHAQVPCNDGGLSLGQAAVAAAKYRLALSGS